MARALRIDKLTLAALESTLRLYLQPEQALQEIPVLNMFAAAPEQQQQRCQKLFEQLDSAALAADIELVADASRVGGGAMPLTELADWAVAINPHSGSTADLAKRLRTYSPAVVTRVHNDRLLVNLRAVFADEEALLAQILIAVLKTEG